MYVGYDFDDVWCFLVLEKIFEDLNYSNYTPTIDESLSELDMVHGGVAQPSMAGHHPPLGNFQVVSKGHI